MKSWRDTLPTWTKHGLTVTLDHSCGITTDTGRVAQPHEENIPEGTP